jgi:predicted ATPase/class 3 adenylate cyclase
MSQTRPIGTVTFLFTDIEGSTQLAQMFGADYAGLVADHFSIIRAEISTSDGVEVNTTGDGLFAAFPSASDALKAASTIQRRMYTTDWPEGGDVSVRIGVHTGEATVMDGDYVGVEVHKAARIMSAGHGGQVLASESARLLSGGDFEYRSLGRHVLRGLESDETVFQLVISDLPSEFPPLNTASAIPNNLPTRVSSIIGRDDDIETIAGLIGEHRLVTILGPGGVGKTSLALTVGSQLVDGFPGGVTFVDLSAVSDPALVVPSIADALEIDSETVEGTSERLGETKALLLLDNFEQVIEAADEIGRLMAANAHARFLVTSQRPLRLAGEQRYVLPTLPVNGSVDSAGVRLFYERALAADPSFSADLADVTALVGRLDGLPLAIELVAARVNLLSPVEMLERIDQGVIPYTASAATPERNRTLSDALSWSYDLLDEVSRAVFRRLSIFASDISLAAAEAVASNDGVPNALAAIGELVDQSMLLRQTGSASRFRMLNGVRRFGRQRLTESNEADDVRERFVAHFCRLGDEAYSGLQSDRGEWWHSHLEDELGNMREVLSILHADREAGRGLELLGNTWRFYQSRGHLVEAELWLQRFFALPDAEVDSVGLVKGVMARAAIHYWRQQPDLAVEDYEEAVERARDLGDRSLIADAVYGLATSLVWVDRASEAGPFLDEARAIYAELGDLGGVADIVAADAFAVLSESGFAGLAPEFEYVADLYQQAGRQVQATQAIFGQTGVALTENRLEDAQGLARSGLARGVDLADVVLQTWGLEYAAMIELMFDDVDLAALLAGAAEAQREKAGGSSGPGDVDFFNARTLLVERFGEDRAEEMVAPGRLMDLADAVQLAMPQDED